MTRTYVFTAFGGPENQTFAELPTPVAASGQLLVAVRAAGVNPTDWKQRANRRGDRELEGPVPMGREVAGVVEQVGPDVVGYAIGDAVLGTVLAGAFTEYALVGPEVTHKPDGVRFTDAAALPIAAATAYDGVVQLAPKAGETVLITGIGGGVGVAATQLALATGARVIGTAGVGKREFVKSLGATHVEYGDGVADRVRSVAPEGIAAIFDLVGGDSTRALGPIIGPQTRIVAAADGAAAAEFGGVRVDRKRNAEVLATVVDLVANHRLAPFVTAVFPFDRIAEAIALVEDGHVTGKVVVEIP